MGEADDRRARDRYRIWAIGEIEGAGRDASPAVTYDASEMGLSLLTRARFEVGATVKLWLELRDGSPPRLAVQGRVVRAGPNDDDPDGLWPIRLGIALDAPVPGLEERLTMLSYAHPLAGR